MRNIDTKTVNSFGDEWSRFDQTGMTNDEATKIFESYFSIFPWDILPPQAKGFDMGCGSGRWSRLMAPKVGYLHCIDPSDAIEVAKKNLTEITNIEFHRGSVDDPQLPPASQDFGYSLGVLHHIPDTTAAIRSCVTLLKPGAPLLLYLYYAFDNRPRWFRFLWRVSNWGRQVVCRLPPHVKHLTTNIIAILVYWPLARISFLLEKLKLPVKSIPLSFYRHHSLYTLRTDARDRFGTPLEQRFSRDQITQMMKQAGLENIRFSDKEPFWCVVGTKLPAIPTDLKMTV